MLDDHDVTVWDANVGEDPLTELSKLLDRDEPDFVGVSLRNIDLLNPHRTDVDYYASFKSMIRLIKEKAPSSKLIVGGTGFSIFAREIMEENKEIDYGVVSDGEIAVRNLLKNLHHPERVKNLVLRNEKGIVFTGKGEPIDFDLLPPPSRNLFEMSEYRKTPFSVGVQSKRGCVFRCAYCPDPFLGGYNLQLRSPKMVVDEIEQLVNDYDVRSFFFVDSIFNYTMEHAREICREIRRRKLDVEWNAYFRENFLNSSLVREAEEAGCRIFEFHSDGACDRALNLLKKNLRIRDIENTFDLTRFMERAGVGYSFFYDLPSGNRENLFALARLTERVVSRCKDRLAYLTFARMRIYPHTLLYEIALREGKISRHTNLLSPIYYKSLTSKIQGLCVSILQRSSYYLASRNFKRTTRLPFD